MALHSKILVGLGLGAFFGLTANIMFGDSNLWVLGIDYYLAAPLGEIFLRILSMVIMPLVFASIALGVAGVGDIRRVGRMGARTLAFFLVTTGLSTGLGLVLVPLVNPGSYIEPAMRDRLLADYASEAASKIEVAQTSEFGIKTLVGIVTRNPFKSAVDGDLLGIIFFGLLFGAAITMIRPDRGDTMREWLAALADIVTKIIDMAMRMAPYGVAGLIFGVTARFGFALLVPLGIYVGLVLGALLLHAIVTMGLIIRVFVGLSPWVFFSRIRAALVTAFSTSSSSATLPTNLRVADEQLGLPSLVSGFVYPLGATMCMNGTALYEGITVIFLCQVFGVDLSLGQMAVVMAMAVVTSIGAAAVPGGSIPLMVGILAIFGVPAHGIAIILGIDRILDMARTTINVLGDHTAAAYVARAEEHWQPHMLPKAPSATA